MGGLDSEPFDGLFDRRAPGTGRDENWAFGDQDLNASARRLLSHLDRLLMDHEQPDWVFLSTIENDADAGRFPEVFRNFFLECVDAPSTRYFVESLVHRHTDPEGLVGRITFETRPGQLARVLALGDGFCWGPSIVIGGVHVRDADVAAVVALNPFATADARHLQTMSRLAWAASRDLDRLGVYASGHR